MKILICHLNYYVSALHGFLLFKSSFYNLFILMSSTAIFLSINFNCSCWIVLRHNIL